MIGELKYNYTSKQWIVSYKDENMTDKLIPVFGNKIENDMSLMGSAVYFNIVDKKVGNIKSRAEFMTARYAEITRIIK